MISYSVLSDTEFDEMSSKALKPKSFRPAWANEVLALAKSHPNEWIQLEEKEWGRAATIYLKPLGLKIRTTGTVHSRVGKKVKFQKGTVFVKWETK